MEIWDLSSFLNGQTPEEKIASLSKDVEKFKNFRDDLKNITPAKLLEIIQLKENIYVNFDNIGSYYSMKSSENTSDTAALAKIKMLEQMGSEMENDMLFFNLWFKSLEDDKANMLIQSQELSEYKHYLERIKSYKKYTLSEDVEKIINIKNVTGGSAFTTIYEIITNAYKFKWGKKEIAKEEIIAYFKDKDPEKRRIAYESILTRYGLESVQIAEIYKNIALDWFNEDVKLRGYATPISSRNMSNDVDDETVKILLETIRENVGIMQEYFMLKNEWNNRDTEKKYPYSRYHLYAPLKFKTKKYTYEKSKKIMLDAYKRFDKRFYDAAMKIFEEKHVHSHPQDKKRSGAFCSFTHDMAPYILLNHTDNMNSLFTMMHEFGHGIHDVFAQKQKPLLRHATIPIAETASTFGEMILAENMLKKSADVEEKKYLLATLLDNQYATIFRQAYFVMFEESAHEMIKEGATKEQLDEKYMSLLKEQFKNMDIPDTFKHEWNQIPHIHYTPFYCYAYAFGNLLVLSLFDAYRKEGKAFIERYIHFLEAGCSKSIPELVKEMGYDTRSKAFWQKGLDVIREELEELKKLQENRQI